MTSRDWRDVDRHHGPAADLPKAWQSRRRFENLAARFHESLAKTGGEVIRAGSLEEGRAAAVRLLGEIGVRLVVLNEAPEIDGLQAPEPEKTGFLRPSGFAGNPEAWRSRCAEADAGVTGAEALLAETGSLVLETGPGKSRLVSLLPPVHIALAGEGRLTADLFTWLAGREAGWPSNVVLVSGPSKTADIEQTLAVGVHGPRRLIVILYAEAA